MIMFSTAAAPSAFFSCLRALDGDGVGGGVAGPVPVHLQLACMHSSAIRHVTERERERPEQGDLVFSRTRMNSLNSVVSNRISSLATFEATGMSK